MAKQISYPYYGFCFDAKPYSVKKDFDNTYLNKRSLEINATVNLTALIDTDEETKQFYKWWRDQATRGTKIFLAEIKYFGNLGVYGIQQITPLTDTLVGYYSHRISFRAEIIYHPDDFENDAPVAEDKTVVLVKSSKDNYILLSGYDTENNPLSYSIQVPPAHGTLTGTAPGMIFTPDEGFTGEDCFSFVVEDFWHTSTPGVVDITVMEDALYDHIVEYTVTGPMRVTGNFFYDIFDGTGWQRGFGGFITPDDNKIKISSYDHQIDERDDVISSVKIVNWGGRTDYKRYLVNKNISSFTLNSDAGSCVGEQFESFMEGTTIGGTFPIVNTSNGVNFRKAFKDFTAGILQRFDMTSGLYFEEMLSGADIERCFGFDTAAGQYFDNFANGAAAIKCIGYIDTRNALSTQGMFTGTTAMVNPDSAAQALILAKAKHDNNSQCGARILAIANTGGTQTCEVATIDGTCDSTGDYKITYTDEVGTVSFSWAATGGTITSGGTTDTVTVSVTSDDESDLKLTCTITDDIGPVISSLFTFTHDRTYSFLYLTLPKSYAQIDLDQFIADNNPTSETDVMIRNNVENCSILVSDIGGKNVKLVNNSNIIGFAKSRTSANLSKNSGLNVETQSTGSFIVENNGFIAGSGGYGGKGGNGANDTYTTTDNHSETRGDNFPDDFWAVGIEVDDWIGWDGNDKKQYGTMPSPTTLPNVVGTVEKGSFIVNKGDGYHHYQIIHKWTVVTPHTRYGGDGGLGGTGRGYNVANSAGEPGSASSPTGGNSGGTGGTGGDFGEDGEDGGGTSGELGYTAAPAVVGDANITWAKIGIIYGSRI